MKIQILNKNVLENYICNLLLINLDNNICKMLLIIITNKCKIYFKIMKKFQIKTV